MVRTKVFVGNLSFKTREAELATEFGAIAKVLSANIITRGPRSLGYGFVELETVEDAKKAVAAMDKKEIDGRPINCELAKPPVEGEEKAQGTEGAPRSPSRQRRAPRARGPRTGGAPGATGSTGAPAGGASPSANASSPSAQGEAKPRQPRQPRQPRNPAAGGAAPADGSSPSNAGAAGGAPRTRAPRKPRAPRAPRTEGEGAATGSPKPQREKPAPRPKRDPNAPDTRVPSQTSLFVANLPFSLTNEQFGAIFTEANLKFKKAHVVTKRNTKSKGFGFVEFDSQEDQQKALSTLQGKKVEERELAFSVALEDPKKAEPAEKTPQSPAPQPAAAQSPAPAAQSPAQTKN